MYYHSLPNNTHGGNGAGAWLASQMSTQEDALYHQNAEKSYVQPPPIDPFTPFTSSVLISCPTDNSQNVSKVTLPRTTDLLGSCWWITLYKAIKPNPQATNVVGTSYPNCRALFQNKCRRFTVTNIVLMETNGEEELILMSLLDLLEPFSECIGRCATIAQLKEESQHDRLCVSPFIAFPIQGNPAGTFFMGNLTTHTIQIEQTNAPANEMYVNYYRMARSDNVNYVPYEIAGNKEFSAGSMSHILAHTYIWTSKAERNYMKKIVRETHWKEFAHVGHKRVDPSSVPKTEYVNLEITGPVTGYVVTIRAASDAKAGFWYKYCDDSGLDYISDWMIQYGNVNREDPLPAPFSRSARVIEHFKVATSLYVYVLMHEFNSKSMTLLNGHNNVTNVTNLKLKLCMRAHSDYLDVNVYRFLISGVWTQGGWTGRSYD